MGGWGKSSWGGSSWGGVSGDSGSGGSTPGATPFVPGPAQPISPVDLLLDVNGDLDITSNLLFSTGLNAVAQGIRIRVQLFKGEWFLNLDEGVPYYEDILGQKFSELTVRAAFRTAIVNSPGVTELLTLEVTYEGATRTTTVAWKTQTTFGLTVEDSLELST